MAPRRRVTSTNNTESSRQGNTSRSSRSQSSRYTALEPEYYNLNITDEKARQNFASFKGRGIKSTQFVSREALEMLGMWDNVQCIFHSVGWGYLLTMYVPTYEMQVLEMTGTMDIICKNRTQPVGVTFKLDGVTRILKTEEINVIYECPHNGRCESPAALYNRYEFWRAMNSDQRHFASGKSKVSMIRNPIFRVIQCILGHTIFCRHESSNVRVEELNHLWGILNDSHFDLSYALLKQLKRLEGQDTSLVCIGGMLTPLIAHFHVPRINHLTPLGDVPTLDIAYLCQMKILTPRKPPFFLRQRNFPLCMNKEKDDELVSFDTEFERTFRGNRRQQRARKHLDIAEHGAVMADNIVNAIVMADERERAIRAYAA